MEAIFIEDGYTEEAIVAHRPGLCPMVKFTFRPALAAKRAAFFTAGNDAKALAKFQAELFAEHIVEWPGGVDDLKDPAKVARMNPNLLAEVVDRILGYRVAIEDSQKN